MIGGGTPHIVVHVNVPRRIVTLSQRLTNHLHLFGRRQVIAEQVVVRVRDDHSVPRDEVSAILKRVAEIDVTQGGTQGLQVSDDSDVVHGTAYLSRVQESVPSSLRSLRGRGVAEHSSS